VVQSQTHTNGAPKKIIARDFGCTNANAHTQAGQGVQVVWKD
jgi:hypothetical protein